MALSDDCLRYRERQRLLTKRWTMVGVLGAAGFHLGLLPLWSILPAPKALPADEHRIQLTVTTGRAEAVAAELGHEPMAAAKAPPAATPGSQIWEAPATPPMPATASVVAPAPLQEPELAEAALAENAAPSPEPLATPAPETVAPDQHNSDRAGPEEQPTSAVATPPAEVEGPQVTEADDLPGAAAPEEATAPLPDRESEGAGLAATRASESSGAPHRGPGGGEDRPLLSGATPNAGEGIGAMAADADSAIARRAGSDAAAASPQGRGADAAPAAGSGPSASQNRTVSCRQCSRPAYPASALEAGIEGQPVVRVQFDANGHVVGVTLEQSSGHGVLDQAALSSLQTWQFNTGGQGGTVSVEIPFVIEGSNRHQATQRQGDREAVTPPAAPPTPATASTQPAVAPPVEPPPAAPVSAETDTGAGPDNDREMTQDAPETIAPDPTPGQARPEANDPVVDREMTQDAPETVAPDPTPGQARPEANDPGDAPATEAQPDPPAAPEADAAPAPPPGAPLSEPVDISPSEASQPEVAEPIQSVPAPEPEPEPTPPGEAAE